MSAQSNLATIKKIGRHHHIVVNGRSVEKRRSETLAFRFLLSLYFKPMSRYLRRSEPIEGLDTSRFHVMSVQSNPRAIEDLKRWTLAQDPFVIYVDRISTPWLESLWEEVALRQSELRFWSTPLDWERTF